MEGTTKFIHNGEDDSSDIKLITKEAPSNNLPSCRITKASKQRHQC